MQDRDEPAGAARPQQSALGLGERLRSARKARAMSVTQAAQSLKLEESTILALEEGRFETLGANVFIRGHLRRYAQLVGLSVDVVLEAYQAAIPADVGLPALARSREAPEQVNLRLWSIWVIVPLAFVLIAFLFVRGRSPAHTEEQSESNPAKTVPQSAEQGAAGIPAASPDSSVGSGNVDPALMATARSADLPAPETQSPRPAAGDVSGRQTDGATSDVQPVAAKPVAAPAARTRLQLRFADDSFASVADADHRLLYGLQRKGSKQDVSGRPPLRIVLGNARAVSVSVDGKSYRIPTDAVADNEARFEVGAAANPPADAVSE